MQKLMPGLFRCIFVSVLVKVLEMLLHAVLSIYDFMNMEFWTKLSLHLYTHWIFND